MCPIHFILNFFHRHSQLLIGLPHMQPNVHTQTVKLTTGNRLCLRRSDGGNRFKRHAVLGKPGANSLERVSHSLPRQRNLKTKQFRSNLLLLFFQLSNDGRKWQSGKNYEENRHPQWCVPLWRSIGVFYVETVARISWRGNYKDKKWRGEWWLLLGFFCVYEWFVRF